MSSPIVRTIAFLAGAVAAVAAAIDMALEAGVQVRPVHLIAIGCTALAAFALRWPSDVTAGEAKELEARARRESIMPPPGNGPRELIDVPGGSHTLVPRVPRGGGVKPATASDVARKIWGPGEREDKR